MIDISDLKVTFICCRTHTSASRPEAGEYSALFAVEHEKTGEKGHLAYVIEWDKRDVMLEQAHTDNPALVFNDDMDGPSIYNWARARENTGVEPITHPDWAGCSHRAYG